MAVQPLKKLRPHHIQFVAEYLVDFNGTAAAKRAGFSPKTPHIQAGHLLKDPLVQAELARQQADLRARTEITQEQVLREYARIAFADIRDYVTWDAHSATLQPSDTLTDDAAAAVRDVVATPGQYGTTIRVKLHDKLAALHKLAMHLGLLTPQAPHPTQVNIFPAQAELEAGLYADLDRLAERLAEMDGHGHE